MDKNTWIGFGLIAVIILGFMRCGASGRSDAAPITPEDSIRAVQRMDSLRLQKERQLQYKADSARNASANADLGFFEAAREGVETLDTLQNEKIRVVFSSRGGLIKKVELFDYNTFADKENPLVLFGTDAFGGNESDFSLYLQIVKNRNDSTDLSTIGVFTNRLYFNTVEKDSSKVVLRLPTTDPDAWLDYEYTLSEDYMVSFRIRPHNLKDKLVFASEVMLDWAQLVPQHEKGRRFEERNAQLQYRYTEGGSSSLSATGMDSETENDPLKWIAYKDQFFSTILIADDAFMSSKFTSTAMPAQTGYMKVYTTRTYIPLDVKGEKATGFRFYLGPNQYNLLKSYDAEVPSKEKLHLEDVVYLGWSIVSWINRILVVPMFDLFLDWGIPIGLLLILMTLVIKLIILPFVFISYKSSAKMRALRPQINEINEKYPADKMQERQQATMELYKQAGVSPMSGCLPMLFQFPVLMAMFWFLPTAIELRGRAFLWADDLSTYDAVINFGTSIPLLGDHLSLFCLLMTIANFGYTYITMQSQNTDPSMKFMKYIMYAMPVMFLFIFNEYAAGLSFYYLVSLFITIFQTMIFRWTLNDKKMLAEIEANKKKRAGKPKSRFMQKLEEMQREQQRLAREKAKTAGKRR